MIDGVAFYKTLAFYNTMDNDPVIWEDLIINETIKSVSLSLHIQMRQIFAVGVYLAETGLSYNEAMKIPSLFANLFSSNAGDPAQRKFWDLGWQAAKSGHLKNLRGHE